MNEPLDPTFQTSPVSSEEALGMSRFSIRRYSIQHGILILALNFLLMACLGASIAAGNPLPIVLSAIALACVIVLDAQVLYVSPRTVQVEIWIRRLGMGDLEYRIEPTGRDEISETCRALEALRQSSIKAMQLDTVRRLSEELQAKNENLERTLEELERTQDVLVSRRKISELGSLAAGLAHELRNPLQFVKNFGEEVGALVQELESILPEREKRSEVDELLYDLKECNERIVRNADRAGHTVDQMDALNSAGSGEFQTVDINGFVVTQARITCRAAAAQIPNLPEVNVDESLNAGDGEMTVVQQEMNRVIANVVLNSCQAMAERADTGQDYRPQLTLGTRRETDTVVISIRDNGTGITPEVIDRIFNPFFTTRPGNRYAGLGLSISHDIVRAHGGTLSVDSEPGNFTEIAIRLPVSVSEGV